MISFCVAWIVVGSHVRDSQKAVATALKQGSNQGLRFMWFNEYKNIVLTNNGEKTLSPIMALFGGMSAGCFSTLGNNPFDVVKVRKNYFYFFCDGSSLLVF